MYELFELNNCQAENGLKLLYVTCFRSEKPWHGIQHTHNFLEIFFFSFAWAVNVNFLFEIAPFSCPPTSLSLSIPVLSTWKALCPKRP